jgi:putative acetyltransferase
VTVIRPYTEADLGSLLDVWYEASLIGHPFLSGEFLTAERQEIADVWLPAAETIVYEDNGQVIGFLSLVDNEVGAIFVHPEHQGRGIGRALMDRARTTRPYLELDVFEANAIGRRFYEAYGFTLVRRHVHDATGLVQLRLYLGDENRRRAAPASGAR